MLKSKLYRLISVICSICFLANFCGVLQISTAYAVDGDEGASASSISLTLNYVDNTEDNPTPQLSAAYAKTTWGTIMFSSSENGDYTDLSTITPTKSNGTYSYQLTTTDGNVYIKISDLGEKVAAVIGDSTPVTAETPIRLDADTRITFAKSNPFLIWAYAPDDKDLPTEDAGDLDKFVVKGGTVSVKTGSDIKGEESPTDGGYYMIAPETTVTIKLTPGYGYQVTSTIIDSMDATQTQANNKLASYELELLPADEPCTYAFEMPDYTVVLGNPFTASDDRINVTASSIKDAVITNASQIIDSGNYEMDVIDTILTEDTKKTLSTAAESKGLTPVSYLDTELSNFWSKASTKEDDVWEQPITSLNTPAKITLTLSQPASGKTYKMFKFDDDTVSEIDTSYDANSGSVSFEIADFSSLMLAEGDAETVSITDSSSSSSSNTTPTIKTGDQNGFFTYSTLMLVSVLGYIASFKFKKKRNVIWF